jgi:hypothetical protein
VSTKLTGLLVINKFQKKKMNNDAATTPRLYALPKVHKDGIPMRPIISTVNSPATSLSNFCNNILKKIIDKDNYNIKNSYDFKDFSEGVVLESDEKL